MCKLVFSMDLLILAGDALLVALPGPGAVVLLGNLLLGGLLFFLLLLRKGLSFWYKPTLFSRFLILWLPYCPKNILDSFLVSFSCYAILARWK